MARKKGSSSSRSSRFPICNREVLAEGPTKNFNCESKLDSSKISASGRTQIEISVLGKQYSNDSEMKKKMVHSSAVDGEFMLINPKDADICTKSMLQEVLNIYMEELPTMKIAANTGKTSTFMEKCVLNGKYCTLILRLGTAEGPGQAVSAITYQIVATDTQYAEIPLAAVRSRFQHKGVGQLMYLELRRRLRDVGISTILCWGDKESEGFWLKQNFTSVAEVNSKGRAPRLPLKADVRRALCFPGGSLLMMSHLNRNDSILPASLVLNFPVVSSERRISSTDKKQGIDYHEKSAEDDQTSTFNRNVKRTVWEASTCSLKSKRVKASSGSETKDHANSNGSSLCSKRDYIPVGQNAGSMIDRYHYENSNYCLVEDSISNGTTQKESQACGKSYAIMLMDIADGSKKVQLTKIIEDLGGAVTTDGRSSSHVLTGRVRRTLNYCTALCSGAWILSPSWLKASSRQGRFVDEMPYILVDEQYTATLKVNLKQVVLRAKENPGALLKGYQICLTTHVYPPLKTLSAIIESAGGTVIHRLDNVTDNFKTIFLTCEEDMEEALLAARKGVRTFSIDWFMNCILKQVLDLDAPQFAVSL